MGWVWYASHLTFSFTLICSIDLVYVEVGLEVNNSDSNGWDK